MLEAVDGGEVGVSQLQSCLTPSLIILSVFIILSSPKQSNVIGLLVYWTNKLETRLYYSSYINETNIGL